MSARVVGSLPAATSEDDTPALREIERWSEPALLVLGIAWLALVVAELVTALPPWLEHVTTAIWGVFLADFAIRLVLAPRRAAYLKQNWVTIIALIVPAFRIFRIARFVRVLKAARAVRGVRAIRLATTFARGKRSIHTLLARRHALGYVIALTVAIVFLGSAGMYSFEGGRDPIFESYGHALWWTAMLVMTMGTEGWPHTPEARILSLLIALYGFAVFGYVTAQLASWLMGKNANQQKPSAASPPDPSRST